MSGRRSWSGSSPPRSGSLWRRCSTDCLAGAAADAALSGGAIAGIIIGTLIAVAAVAAVLVAMGVIGGASLFSHRGKVPVSGRAVATSNPTAVAMHAQE